MNGVKKYELEEKYNVKVYMGNYDKKDFYGWMGEYFADKNYRKKLPYLINDADKIWYLIYERNKFVGFFGIKVCNDNTLISDIYINEEYLDTNVFEFMAKHLVELYKAEDLKVLTKVTKEKEIWENLGFVDIGNRGNYTIMVRRGKK